MAGYHIETKLKELRDLNVLSPTDGYMLTYDSATGLWIAALPKLDDLATPDDNTDLDATDALHGLMSKADKGKLDAIEAGADVTDATNVDAAGAVMESDTDYLDKTHLSQDFGSSGSRLQNLIISPIAGEILRISNCGGSCFSGKIDDNAGAHGGQGLDATHVPYDNDSYEDMFSGLFAYDGGDYWGQIILHNTTRSNSRKIVSVDRANDVITTTSSTDDWADDDDITCESQTNEGSGSTEYFDIDLSDFVGTNIASILLFVAINNMTAGGDAQNVLYLHPYETYDEGKRQWTNAALASQQSTGIFPMAIVGQKMTICAWNLGVNNNYIVLTIKGYTEYADT